MTRQDFSQLTAGSVVILDGAVGSNLRLAGMPVGICSEKWIIENPEPLQQLQRAYVDAGAQIIYAPSFSANRISLRKFGLENEAAAISAQLLRISKEAVGDRVPVAGDLTTPGLPMEPAGTLSYQDVFDAYCEQISALAEAGADLLIAETLMSVDEAIAAVDAAQAVCELPMMCSLTVDADGTAAFGGNVIEAVEALQEMGAAAVGINCSLGPDQLESIVRNMCAVSRIPVIVKPNAGIPVMDASGRANYSMGPEAFARHVKHLVDLGAGMVGGCCGTNPEYIRQVVAAVK